MVFSQIDYRALASSRQSLVFSDIDGTLMFGGQVDPRTTRLLAELRGDAVVGLATGKRLSSYNRRPIEEAEILAVENGCVIYVGGERDPEWDSYIETAMAPVKDASTVVEAKYPTEWKERMFLVRKVSPEDRERMREFQTGDVSVRFNSGDAEFFPARGGKGNAIIYVADRSGIPLERVHVAGDDDNDCGMLSVAGWPYTFHTSPPYLKLLINGTGYVTTRNGHEGTVDILEKIRSNVKGGK